LEQSESLQSLSINNTKNNDLDQGGGQLIWPGGHFDKTAFSRGPYLLMEIKSRKQVLLKLASALHLLW